MDVRTLLSPKKNPFFEHAAAQYFVARADGRTVGRIAAITNGGIETRANLPKMGKSAKPVWAAWVDQIKSKGLDGQAALDQIQQAIAKNK